MTRAVVDTSVLVSALIGGAESSPALVVRACREGRIEGDERSPRRPPLRVLLRGRAVCHSCERRVAFVVRSSRGRDYDPSDHSSAPSGKSPATERPDRANGQARTRLRTRREAEANAALGDRTGADDTAAAKDGAGGRRSRHDTVRARIPPHPQTAIISLLFAGAVALVLPLCAPCVALCRQKLLCGGLLNHSKPLHYQGFLPEPSSGFEPLIPSLRERKRVTPTGAA